MKKILTGICCVAALAVATSVAADEKGAGCGIGKVIMEGKSGVGANVVAAILNDVLVPRTFFMTTGILGCDTTKTVQNDSRPEVFVALNMDTVAADMAKGEGTHLAALAATLGVAAEDRSAFYSLAQSQYGEVFASGQEASVDHLLLALNTAMTTDEKLSKYVVAQ